LVERRVAERGDLALLQLLQHQIERTLSADDRGGKGHVEAQSRRLEFAAGGTGLRDTSRSEVHILPAGEEILAIPFAFAVTHQHEQTITHSRNPNTSVIE